MQNNRIIDTLDKFFSDYEFPSNLPVEDEVDISKLDSVKDNIFLIEVLNGKFRFDHLGESIVDTFSIDCYSEGVKNLFQMSNKDFVEKLQKVVDERNCLSDENSFTNSDGVNIKYRMKIFPIDESINNRSVKRIFGGIRWKIES